MNTIPEGFKEIPGFEGRYAVSKSGEVFNIKHQFIMKQTRKNTGYLSVHIRRIGESRKIWLTQYLVLLAFVGSAPEGHWVDHINRNRSDNRLENLRYVSRSINCHNAVAHKRANHTHFRGVVFNKHNSATKPWVPAIRRNGKKWWGHYYSDPKNAALEYDRMAIEVFGACAVTNQSLGLL